MGSRSVLELDTDERIKYALIAVTALSKQRLILLGRLCQVSEPVICEMGIFLERGGKVPILNYYPTSHEAVHTVLNWLVGNFASWETAQKFLKVLKDVATEKRVSNLLQKSRQMG